MRRYALLLLLFSAASALARPSPLWFRDGQLTAAGAQLLVELARADDRGLRAADYGAEALAQQVNRMASGDPAALERIDADLSAAAGRIASDLHQGRVNPVDLGYDLDIERKPFDRVAATTALAHSSDLATTLDAMEPQLRHYALLKKALARYRALNASHPEIVQLPALSRPRIRPGESYVGVPALRHLLVTLGDMPETRPLQAAGLTLDPEVVRGLKHFQLRHGLDADGVIGRATFGALTTPLSVRVQQIDLSLERIRWLPLPLASPPIIVNIPQFRLFAFRTIEDSAQDILQMDVIVGEEFPARRTPVFAAEMRYVVLRPYWDVPRSIVLKELLPDIRRRAGWLEDHGYQMVRGAGDDATPVVPSPENIALLARGDLRLRQKPGAANALGRIKFMLPNKHDVYLHDTPARDLFARSRRAFSHGCIRVSDPVALLAHVMRDDPTWTAERRDAALALDAPTRVALPRQIPVFILYGTALATEDGRVLFFEDLYREDPPLLARIDARAKT